MSHGSACSASSAPPAIHPPVSAPGPGRGDGAIAQPQGTRGPVRCPGVVVASELLVVPHACTRWAQAVVGLVDAPFDPNTTEKWSRVIAASPGTIRNWCRSASVPCRASLCLGRLLRAVIRSPETGLPFSELLDTVDRRTLTRLLRQGGLCPEGQSPFGGGAGHFLAGQQWVRGHSALQAIERHLLFRGCPVVVPGIHDSPAAPSA